MVFLTDDEERTHTRRAPPRDHTIFSLPANIFQATSPRLLSPPLADPLLGNDAQLPLGGYRGRRAAAAAVSLTLASLTKCSVIGHPTLRVLGTHMHRGDHQRATRRRQVHPLHGVQHRLPSMQGWVRRKEHDNCKIRLRGCKNSGTTQCRCQRADASKLGCERTQGPMTSSIHLVTWPFDADKRVHLNAFASDSSHPWAEWMKFATCSAHFLRNSLFTR